MWITSYFSRSCGSIARSAVLIAMEPREPPISISTGFSPLNPVIARPSSRVPWSSFSRIGEPVSTALPAGSDFVVSGKLQQIRLAARRQSLFASPGVMSDSCVTTGICRACAAQTTGTATKPPLLNTMSGWIRRSARFASP